MSNLPTVRQIIEAFNESLAATEDTVEPDAEQLYLVTLIAELEAVEAAYVGYDGMEAVKLNAANTRIPGLLHLYKIY